VDLAALKAELVATRHTVRGPSFFDRLVASSDLMGRLGTAVPWLANAALRWHPARVALERALGVARDAPLPRYTGRRFDRWFHRRQCDRAAAGPRVILWDDTWVRYHEDRVGRAAVRVLEAAGFEVSLLDDRKCCGRPAASRGLLNEVRRLGEHNLRLLARRREPIVFLEPSCYSVFVDEYRQLGLQGADDVAERCVLVEDLLLDRLGGSHPAPMPWNGSAREVAIHGHCHTKALADPSSASALLGLVPGVTVQTLDTGCCGMAGAFGMLAENRELSRSVAQRLLQAIRALAPGTGIVAGGTSCRHQIEHLAGVEARHPIEVVADALGGSDAVPVADP
jgi:Fe-S oxidoreductase